MADAIEELAQRFNELGSQFAAMKQGYDALGARLDQVRSNIDGISSARRGRDAEDYAELSRRLTREIDDYTGLVAQFGELGGELSALRREMSQVRSDIQAAVDAGPVMKCAGAHAVYR